MTRIVAGTARGRRLEVPRGSLTRPTSDRVREALFSTLTSALGSWTDVVVLDLYAGSGALGLEALSRGAQRCFFVERDRHAVAALRRNIGVTGVTGAAVLVGDAAEVVRSAHPGPADLVLADPPYATPDADVLGVLATLRHRGLLADDALLVLERSARDPEPTWPPGLRRVDERRYGETRLWYLRESDDHARPDG